MFRYFFGGVSKRAAAEEAAEVGEEPAKRHCGRAGLLGALGDAGAPEDSGAWTASRIEELILLLRENMFGTRISDGRWELKRRLLAVLPSILAASERSGVTEPCFRLIDEAVRSGFVSTTSDKRLLVQMGAWKPALAVLAGGRWRSSPLSARVAAVRLYMFFAEHVSFYDDFCGMHKDFWDKSVFCEVLQQMPTVLDELPAEMEADQWEWVCPELEAMCKTVGCFMMFSMNDKASAPFDFDLSQVMPLLERIVRTIGTFDARLGKDVSAKARGDVLEELVRLSGLLCQGVVNKLDEGGTTDNTTERAKGAKEEAKKLLNFLTLVLMLTIPTYMQKAKDAGPAAEAIPADERQLDNDWVDGLMEPFHSDSEDNPVDAQTLGELFQVLVQMPADEQNYRLQCAAPMVPKFVNSFAEQLKDNFVPPALKDFKVVLNVVLQDDWWVASDFLEEVSCYPCLLDFTSKRKIIHTVCADHKMQSNSSDPIRLVVPRDNVLDGVCSSLNLQDQSARIEVPLEIEFRSGYTDDTGQEHRDEGEDQGGLRRQWLDRASRFFIASDLFMAPSDDAAHLAREPGLPTQRRARGNIFVPSPESVCRCVQDDWEEQFELFGCILGFAILYKETIPVHFGHNFLTSVFGLKTDAQDLLPLLESVDATLHKKLLYILDGTYESLGDSLVDALEQSNLPLNFVINETHCPELVSNTLLKEDGDKILVTEDNKVEFVRLLLHRVLISGISRQVDCFRRGLLRVVPDDIVKKIAELMTVKEIELMVCGIEDVDVDDWEKHTQYENGFTYDHQVVRWFWEVVRDMSLQTRAALLSFATGSSQVPSGGFRYLQPELFTIQRVAVTDRFPEAHTCANTIDLPIYTSRSELERKLYFAIQEAGDAFGRR